MRITTNHPASSYGQPVILNDQGEPMDVAPGVRAVRAALGMSKAEVAAACGVSARTVENWFQGRNAPSAAALLTLGKLLGRRRRSAKPAGSS